MMWNLFTLCRVAKLCRFSFLYLQFIEASRHCFWRCEGRRHHDYRSFLLKGMDFYTVLLRGDANYFRLFHSPYDRSDHILVSFSQSFYRYSCCSPYELSFFCATFLRYVRWYLALRRWAEVTIAHKCPVMGSNSANLVRNGRRSPIGCSLVHFRWLWGCICTCGLRSLTSNHYSELSTTIPSFLSVHLS
jgi:hypothetical protein